MLFWNAIGAIVIIAWNVVTSSVLFGSLDRVGLFRVSQSAEMAGLDIVKHNEPAYGFGKWHLLFKTWFDYNLVLEVD